MRVWPPGPDELISGGSGSAATRSCTALVERVLGADPEPEWCACQGVGVGDDVVPLADRGRERSDGAGPTRLELGHPQHTASAHRPSPQCTTRGVETALVEPLGHLLQHHRPRVITARLRLPRERTAVGPGQHERRGAGVDSRGQELRQPEGFVVSRGRARTVADDDDREAFPLAVAGGDGGEELDVHAAGLGVHGLECHLTDLGVRDESGRRVDEDVLHPVGQERPGRGRTDHDTPRHCPADEQTPTRHRFSHRVSVGLDPGRPNLIRSAARYERRGRGEVDIGTGVEPLGEEPRAHRSVVALPQAQ